DYYCCSYAGSYTWIF
nr:immunoglobulin light chain junction region [Macaca mulatta]MOW02209.1 immunoglobulin light chain junction region [Macaca mulatta]MOW02532.1 immunoglobulin light chain junction region [Macaca mulatta]MOW03253.1 immunoglobulin light chain junction region [Macaca mulatta]MOW57296.1 immunoglobulin light chain junction region [Macaca mulatta]